MPSPALAEPLARQARSPQAGGFLLICCIFIGVIVGLMRGQPSLGFLIGTGFGIAAAVAIWLLDRRGTP